jgi:hypothetical protein
MKHTYCITLQGVFAWQRFFKLQSHCNTSGYGYFPDSTLGFYLTFNICTSWFGVEQRLSAWVNPSQRNTLGLCGRNKRWQFLT